jgi:hypothetical protein
MAEDGARMRRREFLGALGGVATWPLTAHAQQSTTPLIGFMSARSPEDSAQALAQFHKASNTAVLSGHCAVVLGVEHARTIASCGWTRNDIKSYLWLNSGNRFNAIARSHRYGKVYNRNLPKWYKREPDSRIPIVESADRIHLFVIGGHAGRFSAFIPGWGHMSTPVLRPIFEARPASGDHCADGVCKL